MKLVNCPRCERHVAVDAGACPFCQVTLGTTSGIARVALVAAVGLTMASCVIGDNGGSDYAGPGSSTITTTTGESAEGTDTSGSGGTGGTGGSSGGAEESSGAAETTTSGGGSDSGGQDYAGAAPRGPNVQARGGGS